MAIRVTSSKKMVSRKGGIKIAVHSKAGMGKTLLAATSPKPVVILTERTGEDCLSESNIKAVYGGQKGIVTDIPIIEAYTVSDIEDAITHCRESDEYETIHFDSVSELSKLKLKEEMPLYSDPRQAYKAMSDSVDELLRAMRDDKKNWVFLFHSDKVEVYDDEGDASDTEFVPGFEGQKLNDEFPHLIGDVYCIVSEFDSNGEEQRMLRTRQGDTPYFAKNRRGCLDELERMHIGRIFWKLKKGTARKKKSS